MEVGERIRAQGAELTAAERRVAEVILASPQSVGFGTVAELARAADVGAASVVRLATNLCLVVYSDLQDCIQRDLTHQLRPAAERIRETGEGPRSEHTRTEQANVEATVDGVDPASMTALVDRLADVARPVLVVSGDASAGVAQQFAGQVHQLRSGVSVLSGTEVAVRRELALADPASTGIVIDLRRYERWVLEAHAALTARGIWTAGLTDSLLSPIATRADVTMLVSAASLGPFDSHVGTLSLLNLIAARTATALRDPATERLAHVEDALTSHRTLVDSD